MFFVSPFPGDYNKEGGEEEKEVKKVEMKRGVNLHSTKIENEAYGGY